MSEQPLMQIIPSPKKTKLTILGLTLIPSLIFAVFQPIIFAFMFIIYLAALFFVLLYHREFFAKKINALIPRYVSFVSSLIRGRWGRILGLGSFWLGSSLEGRWMIEKDSSSVDLSSTRATFSFFWRRKWDVIFPPAFLAALFAAMFFQLVGFISPETINTWRELADPDQGANQQNLIMAWLLIFAFIIPIIAILLYYPLIWGLIDAEVKRYVIDNKTGEVTLVTSVGENLKNIFNTVAGWGSIAAIATWSASIEGVEIEFIPFLFMQLLILMVLALILIPPIILLLFFYMNLFHGALVNYIRIGLKNQGIPFGTFQFNSVDFE